MSYYGGQMVNGVWTVTDPRFYYHGDCPKPDCYACNGKGGYWCGMIGCISSEGQKRAIEAQKKHQYIHDPECPACKD